LKRTIELFKKNFFVITAIFFVILYLFYFFKALILEDFMPSRSDPIGYYLDIKSFFENSSIHAGIIMDEDVSKVGGVGVHGPGYPIFYGTLAKIFGFHHKLMIWVNLFLLVFTFVFLWFSKKLNKKDYFLLVTIQLAYFITLWSCFSYTPELLHTVFANLTAIQLINIAKSFETNKTDLNKQIYFFVCLILLASFFRYSWVLAIVGILPFSKNKKTFFKNLVICSLVMGFGLLYLKLFHSPYYGAVLSKCSALIKANNLYACGSLINQNIFFNLQMFFYKFYFSNYYFLTKLFIISVTLSLVHLYLKEKVNLALSVFFIMMMYFLSLFVLWDAYDTREIRGLTPSLIMGILILIYLKRKKLISFFAILMILVFPTTLKEFHYKIYDLSVESGKIFKSFDLDIFKQLNSNYGSEIITVLIPERFYWTAMPNRNPLTIKDILHTRALALPMKNDIGVPIRYTVNNSSVPPYYLYKKIKVDYVLDLENQRIVTLK
jgi:hypothetical protein